MKTLFKTVKFLFEILFLLLAGFIMLYVTYYFGWAMLPSGKTFGNDIPSAMNNLYYLERWFPPIPHWIHLWSGGMPFLQLYPILPFVTTFFIHKWFGLTIYQAVKLVMFFSLPITATGVAALGRILTKNWWVGIMAGILMLLSPDSWLWITYGGFYAVASSVPLFTWTLIFFCLALEKEKYWLVVLAAFFYGLTWLFHPMTGMLLTVAMVPLGIGFGAKLHGLRGSWVGALRTLAIGILGIALFAFWIFPFLGREEVGGSIGLSAEQMYRVTLRELLGLDLPEKVVYITSTFFTASAVILFTLGVIASFFRRSILRWAVAVCGLALFIMMAPYYAQPIVKAFDVFWTATNVRSSLILRILGPIVAAYGAVSLTRPIFWLTEKFKKNLKGKKIWFYSTETVGGAVGFVVLLALLKSVIIIPPFQENNRWLYTGYGPLRNWFAIKEVNNKPMAIMGEWPAEEYEPLFKKPEEILDELPKVVSIAGDADALLDKKIKLIIKVTGVGDKDRIDIVPTEGGLIGVLGNFSQVSQIQSYIGTSLIQKTIGWQIDCVYYSNLCGPEQIADLYRWFGVSQVWLGGGEELPTNSQAAKARFDQLALLTPEKLFLGVIDRSRADSYFNIYRFKDATGLASITNKPVILVIGDNPPNNDVFDTVFRGLTKVNFGYQEAWSVKGSRFIDDYSPKELSQFEAVILHGYQYHNRDKAWRMLEEYVKNGGKLFVDTGWQYWSKDWGREEGGKAVATPMSKVLPIEKTLWEKIQGGWNLSLPSHQITDGVGLADWGEPLWQGNSWGVAAAPKSALKPGAVSLLENQGDVLMAAWEYGQGKVVWTGFDFWGHLVSYKAEDERKLVRNALSWLIGGNYSETKLNFDRKTPDEVFLSFQTGEGSNKLLFKEVATDSWRASLVAGGQKQSLPIYKAGPGWKMVFLPDNPGSGGEVIFSYRRSKIELLGIFTSLLSLAAILIFILSRITGINLEEKLFGKMKTRFEKRKSEIKASWEDEEG